MSVFTPDGDLRPARAWAYGCLTALLLFIVLPLVELLDHEDKHLGQAPDA